MLNSKSPESAATSIDDCLNRYNSAIQELNDIWRGATCNRITESALSFFNEYHVIVDQLNSYQNANDLYEKYQELKRQLDNLIKERDNASDDKKAGYNAKIGEIKRELENLKKEIDQALKESSSTKLSATSNASSSSTGLSGTSKDITYKIHDYYNDDNEHTTIYYAIIPKNKRPKLAIANDEYDHLTTEKVTDIAKRKNAKLAINFGLTDTPEINAYPSGIIYADGKLVHDTGNQEEETLIMKQDGTLEAVKNSEYSTQDILDMNPVWASKGFHTIYKDGHYFEGKDWYDPTLETNNEPRTFIGQDYDGNYIVGVCDGRGEETGLDEKGLTLPELNTFVKEEVPNLRFLFNGDGGGSSAFVYKGEKKNSDVDGVERPRPDAIYWD